MDKPARTGLKLGCLGWSLLGLTLAAILAASGWIWLASHGDIDELQAELQAQGRPATWEDLGFHTTTAERVSAWKRLLLLGAAVKLYQADGLDWSPRPGDAVPTEAKAFLTAQSSHDATEIRALLEGLGPDPVFTRTRFRPTELDVSLSSLRNLMRWRAQRLSLVEPAEVVPELTASAQLIINREVPTLINALVSYSITGFWTRSACCRLSDIPAPDRPRLALLCRQLEGRLTSQAAASVQTEVVSMIQLVKTLTVADNYRFMTIMGDSGLSNVAGLLALRLARADAIRSMSDFAVLAAASPAMADRLVGVRRLADTTGLPAWSSRRICWETLVSTYEMVVISEANNRSELLLLAAELDGSPWPNDPLDPAGKPYRRFERDGRLIGAYSVGKNGLDDHGSGDDRCLDLYGRCKPPKP